MKEREQREPTIELAVLRNGLQSAMRDELVVRNVATLVQVKTPTYEVGRGLSVDQARTLRSGSGLRAFRIATGLVEGLIPRRQYRNLFVVEPIRATLTSADLLIAASTS